MRCLRFIYVILSVMFVMFTVVVYEARCDIQTDVKIMPKVLKIGEVRTFNAKIEFPKSYDMREWTITSAQCDNLSALPKSVRKDKTHAIVSFSTQDLQFMEDGERALTVTIVAVKQSESITFTGSDTVRFKSYAKPGSCEGLLSLSGMVNPEFHTPLAITSAAVIPAAVDAAGKITMPEFCKLLGAVGKNKFELRMPTKTWNGKLLMVGGGGFNGSIPTGQGNDQLKRGYATTGTDTGHAGGGAAPLYNDLDAKIDFGYRGVHVTAVASKNLVRDYFGTPPKYAYFRGCSTGGRQGLLEAQRYPKDFDAIIAGDPPLGFTAATSIFMGWVDFVNRDAAGNIILNQGKVPLIRNAVNAACDALDGVVDGIIDDPRRCTWDPFNSSPSILCAGDVDAPTCLTTAQANVVRTIYGAPRDKSGNIVFPAGRPKGAELDWPRLIGTGANISYVANLYVLPAFQYALFDPDPGPTYKLSDFPCDATGCEAAAVAELSTYAPLYNATSVDLRAFKRHNAKMIMYGGWATPSAQPYALVDYYDKVVQNMGKHTEDFFRLFMVPGMGHCMIQNGLGPSNADFREMFPQLELWLEKGIAPSKVVSTAVSGPVPTRTRLLCPYPKVAKYKGSGFDGDQAQSFSCVYPDYPIPRNDWENIAFFPWDAPPSLSCGAP
jgi:hypothetical protein